MGKICRNERYLADAHKMFGVKWLRVRDGGSERERTGRGDEKDMTYSPLSSYVALIIFLGVDEFHQVLAVIAIISDISLST